MTIIQFIIWSVNPEIFPGISWLPIRWYGLLFALAFIFGQQIYFYFYKTEGKPEKDVESLTVYLVLGTILGARLGHVLFYEPDKFLAHPIEILKIWKGGLASHGAAIGILVSVWIYCRYMIRISFGEFTVRRRNAEGQGFLYVMDRIVIVVALGGVFVRFGNFMNSEIIGKPTHSGYGVEFAYDVLDRLSYEEYIQKAYIVHSPVATAGDSASYPVDLHIVFKKGDVAEENVKAYLTLQVKEILIGSEYVKLHLAEPAHLPLDYSLTKNEEGIYEATIHTFAIPRHPAQLYESASCLLLFLLLFFLWKARWKHLADGQLFGIFLVILFSLRFLYEFLKENQVSFEDKMSLNMGQWLSIPLILLGLYLVLRPKSEPAQPDAG